MNAGQSLIKDDLAPLNRFSIFDTSIHCISGKAVQTAISSFLDDRRPHQIVTVNVDFLQIASEHPRLQDIINTADLSVPDGVPLVWTARYLGIDGCERITGMDLIDAAARLSVERGARIYLLGGPEGSAFKAKQKMEILFPGVSVCGYHAPRPAAYPFPTDLDDDICNRILEARPDILFVAFGCPKQELWIRDHLTVLNVPVCVGVGGAFTFVSGEISRAPDKLQQFGLEWVYRLWKEPRRLWRRYLLKDLPFMARLAFFEAASRVGLKPKPLKVIQR